MYVPIRNFYVSLTTASLLQLLVALYLAKSIRRDGPTALSAATAIDTKLDTKERLTALISIGHDQESQQLSSLLTEQLEPILKDVKGAEIIQLSISRLKVIQLVISVLVIFIVVNHALKPSPNSSQIALVNNLLNQHQLPPPLEASLNNLVDTLKHEDLSSDEVSEALNAAQEAHSLAESEAFNSSEADERYLKGTSPKDELDKFTPFKNNPDLWRNELRPTSTPTANPQSQDLNADRTRSKEQTQQEHSEQRDKDVDVQHSKSSPQSGDDSGSKGSEGSKKNEPNQGDSSQQSQGDSDKNNQDQQKQQQTGSEGQAQGSKGDSKGSSDQNPQQQSSQNKSGSQGSKEGKDGQNGSEESAGAGESEGGEKPGGQGKNQGQQQQSASGSETGDKSSTANKGSDPALDQVKQGLEAIKEAQNRDQEQAKDQGQNQGQSQNGQQESGQQASSQQGSNQQSDKNGSSQRDKKGGSDNRNSDEKGSEKRDSEKEADGKGSSSKDRGEKESPPSSGEDGKDSSQKDAPANESKDSESEQSPTKKSGTKQEGSGGMALPSEQSETKDGVPEDGDGPANPKRPPQFKEKQIGEAQESYDLSATGSEQGRTLNRNEAEYKRKLKDLNLSKPSERTDSQSQKVPLEYRNWLN